MDSLMNAAVMSNPIINGIDTYQKQSTFGSSTTDNLKNIVGYIITIVALYLAFKCKSASGGIDIVQMILAFCCSPCYVLYRLVIPC
jgi:hypothetical protein